MGWSSGAWPRRGVTGELVVDVRTDDPEAQFAAGNTLPGRASRGSSERTFTVESVRPHGGRLLCAVGRHQRPRQRRRPARTLFVVDSADLPPITEPDEYYDHQLECLRVRTVGGADDDRREVLHTAAGELLSVTTPDGAEVLVPFVTAIVPTVSLSDGVLESTRRRTARSGRAVRLTSSRSSPTIRPLRESLPGKAIRSRLLQLGVHDLRAWTR